jgi:hypothetical protein
MVCTFTPRTDGSRNENFDEKNLIERLSKQKTKNEVKRDD